MSLVTPGEPIAVEEEALPAGGAYISRDGYIRSMVTGLLQFDKYRKQVLVKPLVRRDLTLKPNSVIEGVVTNASEDVAMVKIYASENNMRFNAIGILHVSQVMDGYVSAMYDYIKPGDIVKAKVLNSTPPYLLSVKEPLMGVIAAQCSHCGSILHLHPSGYLVCMNCCRQEKRKIAVGYLYVLR